MVKFIWQHNLPVGLMALSKCHLEGWIFGAQNAKKDSKTKSHRSEPKWLLKYLITPSF